MYPQDDPSFDAMYIAFIVSPANAFRYERASAIGSSLRSSIMHSPKATMSGNVPPPNRGAPGSSVSESAAMALLLPSDCANILLST